MNVIIYLIFVLLFLIFVSAKNDRDAARKNRARLIDEFENESERSIDIVTFEALKSFDKLTQNENPLHIDEDTWADLDMDELFFKINNTNSSIGREYLYYMLHNPADNMEAVNEVDRLANEFTKNQEERVKLQEKFISMGYAGKTDFYSNISEISSLNAKSNVIHYIFDLLFLAAIIIMLAVRTDVGTFMLVAVLAFNVITYFKEKAAIENYLSCAKCVVRMVASTKAVVKMDIPFISSYNARLKEDLKDTFKITRNFYMITGGSNFTGSLFEIILDYVRIIFHIDLIKFNNLVSVIGKYKEQLIDMYRTLGYLESCIAAAAYRNKLPKYCVPQLKKGSEYVVENVYHPLLLKPVENSISADGCILLTGSNASGKSTFLRCIAINAVLSQTIATSVSDGYTGDFYRIVSSMTHRDDIISGDSYYMVEIKALKRILDIAGASEHKVLCFLDEVLRGTNTVERIAASTQILKSFALQGTLCFAATHDIELTELLNSYYCNYHFDEGFDNNDVKYSYVLLKGPAVTRNAIKLLKQNGYDDEIIEAALQMAKKFETNGKWRI